MSARKSTRISFSFRSFLFSLLFPHSSPSLRLTACKNTWVTPGFLPVPSHNRRRVNRRHSSRSFSEVTAEGDRDLVDVLLWDYGGGHVVDDGLELDRCRWVISRCGHRSAFGACGGAEEERVVGRALPIRSASKTKVMIVWRMWRVERSRFCWTCKLIYHLLPSMLLIDCFFT